MKAVEWVDLEDLLSDMQDTPATMAIGDRRHLSGQPPEPRRVVLPDYEW